VKAGTIYAVWVVEGNTEGVVHVDYDMPSDYFEEVPPTAFASRLDGPSQFGARPGVTPERFLRVPPSANEADRADRPTHCTDPWFRGRWFRIYARAIATIEAPSRGVISC
jgi:hypothetical protein